MPRIEVVHVVSLSGNVMLKDDKSFVHVHGVFTDIENKAFGGHIVEMRVHVVLEVMLTPLPSRVARITTTVLGFRLWNFELPADAVVYFMHH